jgi:hypothetical protein
MGPGQKPEWAVGEDGDTSKNLNTETPKTLKVGRAVQVESSRPIARKRLVSSTLEPIQ